MTKQLLCLLIKLHPSNCALQKNLPKDRGKNMVSDTALIQDAGKKPFKNRGKTSNEHLA